MAMQSVTILGDVLTATSIDAVMARVAASLVRSGIPLGDAAHWADLSRKQRAGAVNEMLYRAHDAQTHQGNDGAYRRALDVFRRAVDDRRADHLHVDNAGVYRLAWSRHDG